MRKLYTIITTLSLATISYAQPILNESDFSPATTYDLNVFTVENIPSLDPGTAGPSVTWDFSGITGAILDGTLSIVPVATTPYASDYPTANFSAKELGSGILDPTYIYYKVSSTDIETVGERDSKTPDLEIDHSTFFTFPYVFGTVIDDTYQNESDVPNVLSYSTTYDGYGTLITPYATYNNVIRQKKVEVDGAFTYTDYAWFTANPFKPVVSMSFSTDGVSTSNATIIYADPSLKVNENNKEDLVTVYPNPTTSVVNLDFSNAVTIDKVVVVDITGRVVLQQKGNTAEINVEKLATGLYVIEAYSGKEKFTSKFIKE